MKNILVIDGNSILNRAFYGIRALSTKDGRPTNAIYGLINIVMKQVSALSPDYAVIAFDLHAPTFRKQMYEGYKAGRHETPEELLAQFDGAKACMSALGLNVMTLEGYEADDILGTVSAFASKDEGTHAYILSGDRDLLQLIDENVTVLLATNSETLTVNHAEFEEKYIILPSQFVDLKALMGDSSDNIPGVSGVGEKTAIKLIYEFGSLDGVYENLDSPSISASLRAKLEKDKDNAYLSQTLARIVRNAPIGKGLSDLTYNGIDNDKLYALLEDFELYSFIKKFGLTEPERTCATSPTVELCAEYTECDDLISCVTDDFSIEISDKIYVSANGKNYSFCGETSAITPLFSGDRTVTVFDSKKLYHTLWDNGADVCCKVHDVMLSAYVLDSSNAQKSAAHLAKVYLGINASESSPSTYLLAELDRELRSRLADTGALSLLDEVELPLARVLAKTEKNGFRIDVDAINAFGDRLRTTVETTEKEIYALAGEEFNISSPKQLGEILFEKLSLPHGKKTKSGYSTNAEILESLRDEHPIINLILEYRQLTKLISTYVVGLTKAVDAQGRVHTEFKQALTATGRLSSAEPNLQNIPIRTPLGREMRGFFIADEGCVLVDADYSQIELRLLAAMSGDENMTDAFNSGADIHARTAAAVFNIPEPFVDEDLRKRAKAVNFGIVYGIGAYSLSKDLGISNAEAKQYIQSYFDSYPKIDGYLLATVEAAERDGYTTTLFGRRRYIPELKAQNGMLRSFGKRVAMNSPIQGSAADIMKIAMVRVADRLERELPDAKLIMQVHDELIVECKEADADKARVILCEEMEGAAKLSVALTADVQVGKSWLG